MVRRIKSKAPLVVACVLVLAAALYFVLPHREANAAVSLGASVLCAPNTCNANDAQDSLQDITLYNARASQPSGTQWRIRVNNDSNGLAEQRVIEIANQDNHYSKQVVMGVYVTQDVYNDMPSRSVPLRFTNRDCRTDGDPKWSIQIRTPGTSSVSTLQSYDYGASSSSATGSAARTFCDTSNTVQFNLSPYKSRFVPYGGGSLMYAEIIVKLDTFDAGHDKNDRNVRFRMQMPNICGSVTTCRQYLALVAQDTTDHRNFALSSSSSMGQKKVTNSLSEYNGDRSTYDYLSRTYQQRLMREYLEFGLECSVTGPQNRTIYLYDINDGDNTGAETHGYYGGKDIIGAVLQYFDQASNSWRMVPASSISVTGGALAGSHNTDDISARNHYLYAVDGAARPDTVILPTNSDLVDTRISFTMNPRTRYRVALVGDSAHNFVAMGMPGDQIYGLVGCDSYDLTPKVTGSGTVFAGSPVTFNNTIQSSAGSSATADGIKWRSYGFVVRSGQSIPSVSGDTTRDFSNPAVACTGLVMCSPIGGNLTTGESIPPGGELTPARLTTYTDTGSLGAGDRVCSFMAISPFLEPASSNTWRVSAVSCFLIVTVPKVSLLGNDLRVGSGFSGGTNLNASATGTVSTGSASWVEYAISAPRAVTALASQSGAVHGSGDAQSVWSKLTFANTGTMAGCPSGYGCFAGASSLGKIPDVASGVSYVNGLGHDRGSASFNASAIPSIVPGANLDNFTQSAAISTTGTITIDRDITYRSDTLAGSGDIPQLILIAGNINITSNVHRIDAWLIATGTINTCSDVPQASLRSTNCNVQLLVNGPMMASQLALDRTYWNSSRPEESAEVVNLRGDAYIWANNLLKQNGSWQTVYTTELPPRY